MTPPTPPHPAHVDVTLDLSVHDESFAATDDAQHQLHTRAALTPCPHSTRQYVRLGGTRTLILTLHYPAQGCTTLGIQVDLHEVTPTPTRTTHHIRLKLHNGSAAVQNLDLTLPDDPQPYGHLNVRAQLIRAPADPSGELYARAADLGWTPTRLHTIPGGHQLSTDQGDLYHDGQQVHALHARAALAYQQRGGPGGPLGLPRADALSFSSWVLPLQGHVLTQPVGGHARLLTALSWHHWQRHAEGLGPPVGDTSPLQLHRGQLEITACQTGTLITDPATASSVPARTLSVSPGRVTHWVQDHLSRHLPPGATAHIDRPWPGQPLRYPLTLQVAPSEPIELVVPLALRITPAPDARRPVHLCARQAGLISLPTGLPAKAARRTIQVLQSLLNRPINLASLPGGHSLVGAQVTPDGGLHLDFLPATWHPNSEPTELGP